MNQSTLAELARQLATGRLSVPQFLDRVDAPGIAALGEVSLDLDRRRRCGYPEVVYGEGKETGTLIKIFHRLLDDGVEVLATRIGSEKVAHLTEAFPAGRYNRLARTFRITTEGAEPPEPPGPRRGHVAVVTAGTSDLPVAEEARETLDWMGVATTIIHDVGVAGPHRLPVHLPTLEGVDAVVVVAGMEGALPSVVGGYVACPVVAVPTSVGYGASLGGMTALLGMLNSCASNVTVVNIDAGFKGGYIAGLIAQRSDPTLRRRHREEDDAPAAREPQGARDAHAAPSGGAGRRGQTGADLPASDSTRSS